MNSVCALVRSWRGRAVPKNGVEFLDSRQESKEKKGVCAKKVGALFGKGSQKKNERTNNFYSLKLG
jgi:hypothetical protein